MALLRAVTLSVAFVLSIAVVSNGCSSSPRVTTTSVSPAASTALPTSARPAGAYGELKIALSGIGAQTFDPATTVTGGSVAAIMKPIFDYFVGSDGAAIVPGVVESWEIAPDGLSWLFKVRKGVKFHDGVELSGKDVKFTLDRYASKEAFYANVRDAVQSTELVDDYTVRVITKNKQPFLLSNIGGESASNQGPVIPKHYVEKNGIEFFKLNPIGSGPFKFARSVPGDMVEYEAVDKHWLHTPEFKKLSVILMPEESTRVASLKTLAVDAIDLSLDGSVGLEAAGLKIPVVGNQNLGVRFYGVYESSAAGMPAADVRVRQALSLAINRSEIYKGFFYGKAQPAYAPPVTHVSRDLDVAYWDQYTEKAYRYDPAEAKRLLTQAGFPNGFTIKFYSFAQSGASFQPKLVEVIQGYWEKVGVNTQIVATDWGTFSPLRWVGSGANRVPNPVVVGTVSVFSHSVVRDTQITIRPVYHSTGSYAAFGKTKPEIDRMLEAVQSEMDAGKRKELYAQIMKVATDSYVNFTIAGVPIVVGVGPRVDIKFPEGAEVPSFYADIAKHAK